MYIAFDILLHHIIHKARSRKRWQQLSRNYNHDVQKNADGSIKESQQPQACGYEPHETTRPQISRRNVALAPTGRHQPQNPALMHLIKTCIKHTRQAGEPLITLLHVYMVVIPKSRRVHHDGLRRTRRRSPRRWTIMVGHHGRHWYPILGAENGWHAGVFRKEPRARRGLPGTHPRPYCWRPEKQRENK